jgi:hypothetical protein
MYVQWWSYTSMWVYPSAADRDTRRSDTSCYTSAICRQGHSGALDVWVAGGPPGDVSASEDDNERVAGVQLGGHWLSSRPWRKTRDRDFVCSS